MGSADPDASATMATKNENNEGDTIGGDCVPMPPSGDGPALTVTPTFADDLQALLNRHSMENGSNTPDFMLATYLQDCLATFNRTVNRREGWYGRESVAVPPVAEGPAG